MTPCTWAVTEAEAGQRLDQCVINQLQFSYSRARIQRWLAQGYIQLNDQQGTPSRRVKIGDRVVVDVERAAAHEPIRTLRPEEMPLDVIHEDEDILVVNKSAGIVTHPAPGNWSGTLVNAVLWHLQQQGRMPIIDPRRDSAASGLQPLRPGIVHRLDKETSGLLIVAKTEEAHYVLAKQLTARTIHRQYVACVSGLLDVDEGTVDVALMRHTHDRRRVVVCGLEDGRHAVTHYRVRHRMTTPDRALQVGPYTVIECTLETGRTHQVRVHMQHLGHPVLGDALYGTQRGRLARHLLHAEQLTFIHPRSSAPMRLRAPVPADMATFVQMK